MPGFGDALVGTPEPKHQSAAVPTPAPKAPETRAAMPARPVLNNLANNWREWLAVPQNRAGLIQFGISASQPRPPGQSPFGHLASAVGAGMEARDRNMAGQRAIAAADAESARQESQLEVDRQNAATGARNAETQASYAAANNPRASARASLVSTLQETLSDPLLPRDDPMRLQIQALLQQWIGGDSSGIDSLLGFPPQAPSPVTGSGVAPASITAPPAAGGGASASAVPAAVPASTSSLPAPGAAADASLAPLLDAEFTRTGRTELYTSDRVIWRRDSSGRWFAAGLLREG